MSSNHKEEIFTKFEIVKKSTDHQSLEEESSNSHSHNSQDIKEELNQIEVSSKTPSSSSEDDDDEKKEEEEEEEEDGFRTPTSLDHKISVITCPPTPKKIKVQSLKRKAGAAAGSYNSCRQLPLDLSKEVELLFQPPTHHIQLYDHSHMAKKIRRDDKELK
jgi:hypothetical protein